MQSIHDRAFSAAKQFKKSEIEFINMIQEIDEKKAFFEKKTSTYSYCVARASKKVPGLKQALKPRLKF
jgi:ribonucleotide reductase beta subunit family protein with ferritin-like domain